MKSSFRLAGVNDKQLQEENEYHQKEDRKQENSHIREQLPSTHVCVSSHEMS